jgi:hypothetical protein
MHDITVDPKRIEVWVAMADHFLDTETRHDIPLTAMRCIDAGMTFSEARRVWRYGSVGHDEVSWLRALYPNPFRYAMKPALAPGECIFAHWRVRAALARANA